MYNTHAQLCVLVTNNRRDNNSIKCVCVCVCVCARLLYGWIMSTQLLDQQSVSTEWCARVCVCIVCVCACSDKLSHDLQCTVM